MAPQGTSTPTAIQTVNQSLPERTLTSTYIFTATNHIPSSPPTSSPTLTATPVVQQSCINLVPNLNEEKNLTGKIAFLHPVEDVHKIPPYYAELYFLDLSTSQISQVSPEKMFDVSISPDHQKYIVQDFEDHLFKIYSAEGKIEQVLSLPANVDHFDDWLDQDRIAFALESAGTPPDGIYSPFDILIFNSRTRSTQILSSNYPDIDKMMTFMWDGWTTIKYNPDLSRVIYRSGTVKGSPRGLGQGYILWDVAQQQKITEIYNGNFFITPKWSLDGSKFIISGPVKDILVVTKDGEITQLTDLRSLTPNQVKPTGYSINRYSWSPDGGRIGFWLNYYENNSFVKGTYVILDMSSKRMIDTCISLGTYPSDRLGITDEAVWSPDGRYAVIKANRTESDHFDVLLLDTENGFAMKITDNLEPIGWMVSSNGN
jgi:Tol biopolymer transport system component